MEWFRYLVKFEVEIVMRQRRLFLKVLFKISVIIVFLICLLFLILYIIALVFFILVVLMDYNDWRGRYRLKFIFKIKGGNGSYRILDEIVKIVIWNVFEFINVYLLEFFCEKRLVILIVISLVV